ncbi:unnamed protein product [Rhizophagus irregularis]|nr:unnamed protein product [Rhizophagus irregularis]
MSSEARPIYNFIELGLEEYEENEMILDVVHNLMTFFNDSANCTCRRFSNKKDIRTCFEKVGFKRFFERHMEIKALGKPKFELFIKIQLMSFEISNEKIEKNETEKKTRHSYKYSFNISLPLCKPAYLKLCNLSDYKLSALQTHLQENGLTERTHGNTGCVSRRNLRVFVDFNITSSIKEFLTQYGTIHGLPSPMRHQNDSGNFIYLPTNENYTLIYNKYKEHYCLEHSENENIISYSTFRRLWHELMPNLKFQSPASDLCETCEEFKAKMRTAKSDIDKFNIIKNQFEEHQEKADLERQHYNNNIEKKIVNKSSKNNEGIRYNGGIGWKCSLPQDLGKVYCSEKSGGNEICHKLLRDNNNFDKNEKLNVLDIMPMSDERKKYLYQKIRTTCRRPT